MNSCKVRCLLAVAAATMVSFAAFAGNSARYSLDRGVTWTETTTIDAALMAVNGQTGDAIVEALADQGYFVYPTDLFWHGMALNCNLTLRSAPGLETPCKITRGTNDASRFYDVKNGKTLTLANITVDAGTGMVNGLFNISSGGTLNLDEGVVITTSEGSAAGNAIKVSGTLRFNGGVVRGWNVTSTPVVYGANTGRIYLSAGGVENCSTSGTGLMVASAIGSGSTGFAGVTEPAFIMTGGFIRNNHCSATSDYQAALAFRENVIVEITGGEITGNTGASETAFGVIAGQNGKLNIGGNAVISGNQSASGAAANVGCVKAVSWWDNNAIPKVIQISNLTEGSNVGVYSQNNYTEAAKFGTLSAPGFLGSGNILNDRDGSLVGVADGTDLKWGIGGTVIVDPAIGRAMAAPVGSSAVIRLVDVVMGTDGEGVPATAYSVRYSLDKAPAVTALSGQTATTAQFTISDLADGPYSCKVWIETDVNTVSPTNTLNFTVDSTAPAEGDFDALKSAIENASADDVIVVDPGLYHATSSIAVSKKIKIVSAAGSEHTIIDGCYPDSSFALFRVSAEQVKVSGLTFRNSGGSAIDVGSNYHGLEVADCAFTNCHAAAGAGVGGAKIYPPAWCRNGGPDSASR